MAKWAHTPPGTGRVVLVLGIVAACLIFFGIEKLFGLPEWMAVDPSRKTRFPIE
ncbi:MAG: hypothetical protein AAFY25_11095 [Pseudomonadota bacterium]